MDSNVSASTRLLIFRISSVSYFLFLLFNQTSITAAIANYGFHFKYHHWTTHMGLLLSFLNQAFIVAATISKIVKQCSRRLELTQWWSGLRLSELLPRELAARSHHEGGPACGSLGFIRGAGGSNTPNGDPACGSL